MKNALFVLCLLTFSTAANAGVASWYSEGRQTANGERFRPDADDPYTCAHRTLPFGALVRVTATASGRSIICRINDRGPFVAGRDIDVNRAGAKRLGIIGAGVARVSIERVS